MLPKIFDSEVSSHHKADTSTLIEFQSFWQLDHYLARCIAMSLSLKSGEEEKKTLFIFSCDHT